MLPLGARLGSGLALLALLFGACMPIPTVRAELNLEPPAYRVTLERVRSEYVTLPGFSEPHTPERYNQSYYLRYYASSQPPETVLVLMPGLFAGASGLDILARQLVASAEATEVWVIDRRANALEDRSAMLTALEQRDPQIAYDYYVTNAETDEGFQPIPPEELGFLAFWGLEVHLRDLHAVVTQAEATAERVILGGHSLGASIVSFYSSFDFADGGTPDPGYAHIDGLVLLDGALGRTGGFAWEQDSLRVFGTELIASVPELEAGRADPYLTGGFDPLSAAQSEVNALLAALAPDDLSPGEFVDYLATNRAAFGISGDDQYGFSTVFSVSMGQAVDAEFGGNLPAVLVDGGTGVYSRTVTGVAEGATQVRWERGDPMREVTNPDMYARSKSLRTTNSSEWYFPLRLGLDMITPSVTLADAPGFVPTAEVTTPTLAVGAGRGLIQTFEDFSGYGVARGIGAPFSAYILEGFTHSDVVAAEVNPVVPLVQQWLERVPAESR